MARYALIVSGVVVNVIKATQEVAEARATALGGTAVETNTAGPGDTYADSVFTPATPADPVPAEVTMRQARLALLGAGLLDAVIAAIDAMSEPTKTAALIEWDYSNTLRRDHPLVATLGAGLGLTSGQLDDLFRAAGVL
jgi:hypothetical protein